MEEQRKHGDTDVEPIFDALISERHKLTKDDLHARTNIISQARALIAALETPMESVLQIILAEVGKNSSRQISLTSKAYAIYRHTPCS